MVEASGAEGVPGRCNLVVVGLGPEPDPAEGGAQATAEVSTTLDLFGWEPEDVGFVQSARALEPLCQLWCAPGFLRNQWTHACHLLKGSVAE